MSTRQTLPFKDSSILIVGAGVFGLSSALHLARDGYTDITVLDRAPVPSPYSAGNDLNKIVRAEYEDPFYTELALDAITEWQSPFWSPYFRLTGYVLATSLNSPQKARDTLQQSFSSIKNHPDFPAGSFSPLNSSDDVRQYAPMLSGEMQGWSGYFNKYAGYAKAAKALEHAAEVCKDMAVKFVTGDDGYAVEILYESGAQGKKRCIGVKAASGRIHKSSRTIICLGAHIGSLLPEITEQVTAKAWAVGLLQLSKDEAKKMKGCPVVNCRDLGFFFEPNEETGLLKLCANGAGYTNNMSVRRIQEQVSLPTSSNEGMPAQDERLIRRLIEETMPQFSRRELVSKFICWCGDTADSDYIIDFVPGVENLIVAAGDSGHAFKMLPVAGKWVSKILQENNQGIQRWRWREGTTGNGDISWRVGKVQDLKEVEMADPKPIKASL